MYQKYRSLGLCLALAGALALGSCSKSYDDSALQGRITNVEGRVTQIENQLKTMNTNISSLQAMVEALKSNTPISAVTPVANNGYQLTFSGGKSITIYPDASGRVDSSRPTPRFKIENDYWFVSYDNAQSWERLSRAKGDQGERGVPGLQGERGIAGERGANGHTPVIGMERGSDGQYYWTVDGRRLQTSGGGAVTAVTTPRFKIENNRWYISYDNGSTWTDLGQAKGDAGITPTFRIQNDYWEVSYNNGSSWTQLGRAREAAGTSTSNGANSVGAVFRTVMEDNSAVHVTLASGDRLSIPKVGGISINFSQSNYLVDHSGGMYSIDYTLSGQSIGAKASVEAIAQDGYRVYVHKETEKTGRITIYTPADGVREESRIILLVSDGISQTITSTLQIYMSAREGDDYSRPVLEVRTTSDITLPKGGGTAEVVLFTNTTYRVSIPTEAQSWIQLLPNDGRAIVRKETLRFKVTDNNTGSARSAVISLLDASGSIQNQVTIRQGRIDEQTYHVATPGTLDRLINLEDRATLFSIKITGRLNTSDYQIIRSMSNLRNLDLSELTNTTMPDAALVSTRIKQVSLPRGLTAIPERLFQFAKLTSIVFPVGVQSIGVSAFNSTSDLRGSVVMPPALKTIGSGAFSGSGFDGALVFNDGLTSIGASAFENVRSMTGNILIPNSVTTISRAAFAGAQTTGDVLIGNGVVSIGDYAFQSFKSDGVLTMGTGLKSIGNYAFRGSTITIAQIGANVTEIGWGAFSRAKFQNNLIIPDAVEVVPADAFGSVTIPGGLLVIGSGVKYIGERAFASISSLQKVWSKAITPPSVGNYVFENASRPYLGVPVGSKDSYRRQSVWIGFTPIEEVAF